MVFFAQPIIKYMIYIISIAYNKCLIIFFVCLHWIYQNACNTELIFNSVGICFQVCPSMLPYVHRTGLIVIQNISN